VSTCLRGVDARREKVDIPSWRFALPEPEYQACTLFRRCNGAPDGCRMPISVEVLAEA